MRKKTVECARRRIHTFVERKREREKERESQSHRVERRRRSSVLGLVVGRGPLTFFALESCLLVVY